MTRAIEQQVKGQQTFDGAGVDLVRVLGHPTAEVFDPILMLDSFDSTDPEAYKAGFPSHPHRGIESISYLVQGQMMHRDSLGHEDTISDGEVQWMTAGSGIQHEEQLPASERLLGVQLWLNLPAKDKMVAPAYHHIKREDIPEVAIDGGKVRVLAGAFNGVQGFQSSYVPLDYYDVQLDAGKTATIATDPARMTMVFTLLGDAVVEGEAIAAKTAVKLASGNSLQLAAGDNPVHILVISAPALHEPIAWHGPVVMNSLADIAKASAELRNGKFLKHEIQYE